MTDEQEPQGDNHPADRSPHCTERQRKVLEKFGYPTKGVSVKQASKLISAISDNNWQRPE